MIDYYLRKSELVEDSTGYTAVVFQSDIVTEAELAHDISQTVGGITEGQVALIIDAYNKRVGSHLAAGRSVKTGLFSTSFSIGGAFPSPDADYNPAVNTTRVNVRLNRTLSNAAQLAQKVKHAGINNSGPSIDAVIDLSTGKANTTLHPGTNASVLGARLKIEGDLLKTGITLTGANGTITTIPPAAIAVNHPKTITFIVPALLPGDYTLQVATQYTGGALVKLPQTCFFPAILTVPVP